MSGSDSCYDVIIAGTGVAGLYTALQLDRRMRILILTKREWKLCNTALAQGGIAAVYHPEEDTIQLHTNDTLIAGGFKNNLDAIKLLVTEAEQEVEQLIEIGVEFDRNVDGTLNRTLEGGHSRRRIFHHQDSTGFELVCKLHDTVLSLPNVTIMENTMVTRAIQNGNGFEVEVMEDCPEKGTESSVLRCSFLVLATGGIGRAYEYTTNSAIATGDGITLAYEMGAEIRNLSLVQFHPTAFSNKSTRECFLISEAVRGEGAYLLNCDGERFMQRYDERLELAPRDVVSHSIIEESRRTGSNEFFLDITHKPPEFIRNRFPMIHKYLISQGYDLTSDRIPIYPCQHYLMGGVQVDLHSETDIEGLYAVGECSHTGVHGNNRLASNSLLEALVFARQAARDISGKFEVREWHNSEPELEPQGNDKPLIPQGIRTEIRHIMQSGYFVIPDKQAALAGYERIKAIKRQLESGDYLLNADFVEAKSLATVAYLILKEVI